MSKKFSPGDTEGDIDVGVSSAANSNGTAIDVGAAATFLLSIRWSGHNTTDAIAMIEIARSSSGGWEYYPDSSFTLSTASGEHYWEKPVSGAVPFVRVVFQKSTNTTGTFTTWARLEMPTSV